MNIQRLRQPKTRSASACCNLRHVSGCLGEGDRSQVVVTSLRRKVEFVLFLGLITRLCGSFAGHDDGETRDGSRICGEMLTSFRMLVIDDN